MIFRNKFQSAEISIGSTISHISNADHLDTGVVDCCVFQCWILKASAHDSNAGFYVNSMHRNRIKIFTVQPILVMYLVGGRYLTRPLYVGFVSVISLVR